MSLWQRILDQTGVPGWAWFWTGERYERHTYQEDLRAAQRVAAALRARGLERGGTVAAILTNSVSSVQGVVGAWWLGAPVASLPIIARGQSLPAGDDAPQPSVATDQLDSLVLQPWELARVVEGMDDLITTRENRANVNRFGHSLGRFLARDPPRPAPAPDATTLLTAYTHKGALTAAEAGLDERDPVALLRQPARENLAGDPTRTRTVFADRSSRRWRPRPLSWPGSGASGISGADPARPPPNQLDRAPSRLCARVRDG